MFLISGISLIFMIVGAFLGYFLSRKASKKDLAHLTQFMRELSLEVEIKKLKSKILEIEERIEPKKTLLLPAKKRGRKPKTEIV